MQDGDGDTPIAEAGPEATDQLRCQGDFRNQNQSLFSFSEDGFDQPQVYFGFAAAGDAVQQGAGKTVGRQRLLDECTAVRVVFYADHLSLAAEVEYMREMIQSFAESR